MRRTLSAALPLTLVVLSLGCASVPIGPSAAPSIEVEKGLVYSPQAGAALRADLYSPAGDGPHPGVVVVHPGGWSFGSRADVARIGRALARRGYVAMAIDYRLAPEHLFPAPVDDCRAAVRWLREHARDRGIDPNRIAIYGYSSGAHLAGYLAATNRLDPRSAVQAAVLGGTPADLSEMALSPPTRRFLGASIEDEPALYRHASPIAHVDGDEPPTFVYHGDSDWFVPGSQSRGLVRALRKVGARVEYARVSGGHLSTFLFGREIEQRSIDFLDRWLRSDVELRVAAGPPSDTDLVID